MSQMSDYLEDALIQHIFRNSQHTKPTTIAIALLTTDAVDGDTGQFSVGTGVEVTNANAYTRQTVGPSAATWNDPSAGTGQTANTSAITWTTATGSWGTVVGCAIVDSATYDAGNMYFRGSNNVDKAITTDDTAEFAAGALTVTLA